jgi:hypothetical protein
LHRPFRCFRLDWILGSRRPAGFNPGSKSLAKHLVRNRVPRSKGQGRLTARDNTTREEWKLDPVTGHWGWKEVANRQTGYDWTFSVPKSVSLYLARTEDPLVEKLAHQALAATMDEPRPACSARFGVKVPTVTRATMTG